MIHIGLPPQRALVEANRVRIRAVAMRHGSARVGILGSVARGDESADSDIDFLSDFEPGRPLFDRSVWRTISSRCSVVRSTSSR